MRAPNSSNNGITTTWILMTERRATVKWSQGHSSENKRPVDVSPHRYQHCCDDRSMVLPGGWARRENGDSTDGFFHEGFPTAKLNYPLPLPATDQTIEMLPPTRFLFSRTRIGYFVGHHIQHQPGRLTRKGIDTRRLCARRLL